VHGAAGAELPQLRPLQVQALSVLYRAESIAAEEARTVTAAVVVPTGTGKDLLPLAWAVQKDKVCILFVPYVHLGTQALEYARTYRCVAERFKKGMLNTAANVRFTRHTSHVTRHTSQVLVVGYQQANVLMPLVQTLHGSDRLAAIFLNEVQVLDEDADWRDFVGMIDFFRRFAALRLKTVVVFMTATLPNPARVLQICGFLPVFDAELVVSPMRANLRFEHKMILDGKNGA
jgi:hypothetical protein